MFVPVTSGQNRKPVIVIKYCFISFRYQIMPLPLSKGGPKG